MKLITRAFNKLVFKIQTNTNKYYGEKRKKSLLRPDFSIISNNCWGGVVYQYYNIPYLSPTAGVYFFAEDYMRFVKNLRYYMSHEVRSITANESAHKETLYKLHQENVPIGLIDDVEVVFLHYKTFEEAVEKWNRRKSRINWDNLYIKMSFQNECKDEYVYEFDRLPYRNKLFFVTKDYGVQSQIIMKDRLGDSMILNDTDWFNKFIDVTKFINTGDLSISRK